MATIAELQLPPPKTWEQFELFSCDLWRALWKNPNAQRNGRGGQAQHGVDVFGELPNGQWAGVQCKGKDNYSNKVLTEEELRTESEKAKSFTPPLSQLIFATTAPRDAVIQAVARELTTEHKAVGLFDVYVWSWDDIKETLPFHSEIVAIHFPDFAATNTVLRKLDQIQLTQQDILLSQSSLKESLQDKFNTTVPSTGQTVLNALATYHEHAVNLGRDYLKANRLSDALKYLTQQREVIWPEANNEVKARMLAALGGAKIGLGDEAGGAADLIEAWRLNPANEKLHANAAAAHFLLGDIESARDLAQAVLIAHPSNVNARAVLIQASEEPLEQIIASLPDALRESADIAYAIGTVAWKQGALDLAESWYRIATRGADVNPDIKAALAQTLLQRFHSSPLAGPPSKTLGKSSSDTLSEIEQLYSESWENIHDDDARRPRLPWIVNRGLVRRLLGQKDLARRDFDEALKLAPNDPMATYFLALLADDAGDRNEALKLAESITDSNVIPPLPLFIAELKGRLGGPRHLIDYLKPRLGALSRDICDSAILMLIGADVDGDDLPAAVACFDDALKVTPNSVQLLVIGSKVKRKQGLESESLGLLARAEQCVIENTPARELISLAEELYNREEWERAARAFVRVVDPRVDCSATYKLLNSYYRVGFLDKALDVCAALKGANGPILYASEIESAIFEETGDLPASEAVCNEYLACDANSPVIRTRLAVVFLRSQKWTELDEFLAHPSQWKELPLNGAIQIANLLAVREKYRESTELLYCIRRRFPGEGKIHLRYVQSILFQGDDSRTKWLEVEKVSSDCAVKVELPDGSIRFYILESEENPRIELGEVGPKHQIWRELYGKCVGDEFVLGQGLIGAGSGKIVAIQSKYVHAFHECGSSIQALFPEVEGFQSFEFGDDPETGFNHILEQVGRQSEGRRTAYRVYSRSQLPLASLAHLLGIDVIDAWTGVVNDRSTPLRCSFGSVKERADAIAMLSAGNRPRLVIDPVALLTIDAMQVKDAIIKVTGRLGIAQATIDLFSESLHKKRATSRRGFVTLGKEGDSFVKQEVKPEDVERYLKWLESILSWIGANCDVLSWSPSITMPRSKRKELTDFIGQSSMDSVFVAATNGLKLYSDDHWLRALAKGEFNTDGLWTQPVMIRGVEQLLLERSVYDRAVIGLVSAGYTHTSVDAQVIVEAARIAEWRAARPFDQVVIALKGPDCTLESAVAVTADVMSAFWDAVILPDTSKYLIYCLLDAAFTARDFERMMLRLILAIRNRFWLNPIAQDYILRLLGAWSSNRVVS